MTKKNFMQKLFASTIKYNVMYNIIIIIIVNIWCAFDMSENIVTIL